MAKKTSAWAPLVAALVASQPYGDAIARPHVDEAGDYLKSYGLWRPLPDREDARSKLDPWLINVESRGAARDEIQAEKSGRQAASPSGGKANEIKVRSTRAPTARRFRWWYRNAFIDFIINEDMSVSANSVKTVSVNRSVGSLDYENLKIIAVMFSSAGNEAFSNPSESGNPFTAHYADAANETYVVQGARNLPPEVGILSPQKGKIYIRGNLRFSFLYKNRLLKNTWMIGKASIDTYAKDDFKITKVAIYVNDKLVANMS